MAKLKTGPKVKRKGGGIPMKAKKVDVLTSELAAASSFVVTEYRGLKVGELQGLRRRLRPHGRLDGDCLRPEAWQEGLE